MYPVDCPTRGAVEWQFSREEVETKEHIMIIQNLINFAFDLKVNLEKLRSIMRKDSFHTQLLDVYSGIALSDDMTNK